MWIMVKFPIPVAYIAGEVLIFFATEVLIRLLVTNPREKTDHVKVLVIQGSVLLLAALVLHLFHHMPFLLVAIVLFMFAKLLSMLPADNASDGYWTQRKVSKPLLKSFNDTSSVSKYWEQRCSQQSNQQWLQYRNNLQQQQKHYLEAQQRPTLYHQPAQKASAYVDARSIPQTAIQTSNAADTVVDSNQTSSISPEQSTMHQPSINPPSVKPSLRGSQRKVLPDCSKIEQYSSTSRSWFPLSYITNYVQNHQVHARAPPGIKNTGNTCFVNSTLQSLARTPGFLEALTFASEVSTSKSTALSDIPLASLLQKLLSKCTIIANESSIHPPLDAKEFLTIVAEKASHLIVSPVSRERQSQQDASEFLLWLLDSLHIDLSCSTTPSKVHSTALKDKEDSILKLQRNANSSDISTFQEPLSKLASADWVLRFKKSSSPIHDLFLGQMVEVRACKSCQKMSANVEYFTVLPLPIPMQDGLPSSGLSLRECFDCFGSVEDMNRSNMMACSCALQDTNELALVPGERVAMLSRLPPRLILQLTRFCYDGTMKTVKKNNVQIIIPTTLDVSSFTLEKKLHTISTCRSTSSKMQYKLYAFCIHTGAQSAWFGHYIAYCSTSEGAWYRFNDSYVSAVSNIEQELSTISVLENAYILFYTCSL